MTSPARGSGVATAWRPRARAAAFCALALGAAGAGPYGGAAPAARAQGSPPPCLDLDSKLSPAFAGTLRRQGPPAVDASPAAGADVLVLELEAPQCLRDNALHRAGVTADRIQVETEAAAFFNGRPLDDYVGARVTVRGRDLTFDPPAAARAPLRAPAVMTAIGVEVLPADPASGRTPPGREASPAREGPATVPAPSSGRTPPVGPAPPSPTARAPAAAEAGARAAVLAFYEALGRGDGEAASALVVPGKRAAGPFSAGELTRFFGSLATPLRVLAVAEAEPNLFRVRYAYEASRASRCDGEALVELVRQEGGHLISGIRALSRC